MDIIILPKNIYEINNQKVIDNEVDNIEVSAKEVAIQEEFNVIVHEETFSNETTAGDTSEGNNYKFIESGVTQTTISVEPLFCYVSIIPKYMNVDIVIKKRGNNKRITKVNAGADGNGDAEIHYQLIGAVEKSKPTMQVDVRAYRLSSNQDIEYTVDFPSEPAPFPPYYENQKEPYSLPTYKISQTETTNVGGVGYDCEANIYVDNGNIKNPTIQETENEIRLSIRILASAIIRRLGATPSTWQIKQRWGSVNQEAGEYEGAVNETKSFTLSGEEEVYTVSTAEFTVYGNTIGINLEDKTVKIGSGKHVASFSGNELMQITNTPSIESTYENIIKDWKEWKEVAVLRCSLDEYSAKSETKDIAIEITDKTNLGTSLFNSASITFRSNQMDAETQKDIKLRATIGGRSHNLYNIQHFSGNVYTAFVDGVPFNNIALRTYDAEYTYTPIAISLTSSKLPMTFSVGDVVEPYIFTASGQNKPMSLYKDGSAKKFLVVSAGVTCDGAISQEITIQEIAQK